MKIYENLTLLTNDLDEALEFSSIHKNKKLIFYIPLKLFYGKDQA